MNIMNNEKYVKTLEEILDMYAENCKDALSVVINSGVTVIKTFKEASMSRDIIETEISKMRDMINYLTRNYEEKSNRIGVVALDLGVAMKDGHFVNMYEYARMALNTVQEKEFKDTNIDIRMDEF